MTLSLASSVMKMKSQHNLVRRIESVEHLGSINEICVGKTGTLTNNEMEPKQFCFNKEVTAYLPDGADLDLLAQAIIFNSTAQIQRNIGGDTAYTIRGDRIEAGLLNFLIKSGVEVEQYVQQKYENIQFIIPMNPNRKMHTTVF